MVSRIRTPHIEVFHLSIIHHFHITTTSNNAHTLGALFLIGYNIASLRFQHNSGHYFSLGLTTPQQQKIIFLMWPPSIKAVCFKNYVMLPFRWWSQTTRFAIAMATTTILCGHCAERHRKMWVTTTLVRRWKWTACYGPSRMGQWRPPWRNHPSLTTMIFLLLLTISLASPCLV